MPCATEQLKGAHGKGDGGRRGQQPGASTKARPRAFYHAASPPQLGSGLGEPQPDDTTASPRPARTRAPVMLACTMRKPCGRQQSGVAESAHGPAPIARAASVDSFAPSQRPRPPGTPRAPAMGHPGRARMHDRRPEDLRPSSDTSGMAARSASDDITSAGSTMTESATASAPSSTRSRRRIRRAPIAARRGRARQQGRTGDRHRQARAPHEAATRRRGPNGIGAERQPGYPRPGIHRHEARRSWNQRIGRLRDLLSAVACVQGGSRAAADIRTAAAMASASGPRTCGRIGGAYTGFGELLRRAVLGASTGAARRRPASRRAAAGRRASTATWTSCALRGSRSPRRRAQCPRPGCQVASATDPAAAQPATRYASRATSASYISEPRPGQATIPTTNDPPISAAHNDAVYGEHGFQRQLPSRGARSRVPDRGRVRPRRGHMARRAPRQSTAIADARAWRPSAAPVQLRATPDSERVRARWRPPAPCLPTGNQPWSPPAARVRVMRSSGRDRQQQD